MQSGSDLLSNKKEIFTFWKWVHFFGSPGLHLSSWGEKKMMLCELKGLNHFLSLVESGPFAYNQKIKTEWHVIQILPASRMMFSLFQLLSRTKGMALRVLPGQGRVSPGPLGSSTQRDENSLLSRVGLELQGSADGCFLSCHSLSPWRTNAFSFSVIAQESKGEGFSTSRKCQHCAWYPLSPPARSEVCWVMPGVQVLSSHLFFV